MDEEVARENRAQRDVLSSHQISEESNARSERPVSLTLACKRTPVAKLRGLIPDRFLQALEHNQQIASCCRHPENHEIEAFKSRADEIAPDIYIFHCRCGRQHRRFCVGGGDERPFWEVG